MKSLTDRCRSLRSRLRYPAAFLNFRQCGRNVWLGKGGTFIRASEITLGSNIFINRGFHISARDLCLGSDIMIGPNLVIECDDHVSGEIGQTMFENRGQRVVGAVRIENDVWMGANVTILKDVTVGEGCVIGAHSVVSRSTPPYSVCVGAPCRPIRPRFSPDDIAAHLQQVGSEYTAEAVLKLWNAAGI